MATESSLNTPDSVRASVASPWLDVREAAARAKCGTRSIYSAVQSGKLQAAKLGGRKELRFLTEWIDAWQFAAVYIERASKASGKRTWKDDEHQLSNLRAHRGADGRRLGDRSLSSITEDELEAFHASLGSFAASTRNQYVQLLKASFRWAAKKGYISRSPISEDSALKRSKTAQRRRRVSADEEKTLLDASGVSPRGASLRLQWLIIAAIETGCRIGELLALLWADVDLSKPTVYVRAVEEGAKKTGRSRLLPMSARLAAILEMAKADPAGRRYPPTAYVFGKLGTGFAA